MSVQQLLDSGQEFAHGRSPLIISEIDDGTLRDHMSVLNDEGVAWMEQPLVVAPIQRPKQDHFVALPEGDALAIRSKLHVDSESLLDSKRATFVATIRPLLSTAGKVDSASTSTKLFKYEE